MIPAWMLIRATNMKLFAKTRWMLVDCLTGNSKVVERIPFAIGSAESADFRLNGVSVLPQHCAIIHHPSHGFSVAKLDPAGRTLVNGMEADFAPLKTREDYTLTIGRHLLIIRGDKDIEAWRQTLDHHAWTLHEPGAGVWDSPRPLLELLRLARMRNLDPDCILVPTGAQMGFFLHQLLELFGEEVGAMDPTPGPRTSAGPAQESAATAPEPLAPLPPLPLLDPVMSTIPADQDGPLL